METSRSSLTIPGLIADAVTHYQDHLAVVDGDVRVTYRELAVLVDETARGYIASGIRPGDRVAIWAPNRLEFILAMAGAQSAGASIVPLNTRYQGHEAAAILARSRASALVLANGFLQKDYAAMLRGAVEALAVEGESGPVPGLPHLKTVVDIDASESTAEAMGWPDFIGHGAAVSCDQSRQIAAAVSPDDICDIMFTSGTTGVAKGVMSAHRQTIGVATVWGRRAGLSREDRYAIVNPFFHGFGYKAGLIASLVFGVTIYPIETFNPDRLLELIQDARITVLPGAPTLFTSLLEHPRLREFDLSSLRFAVAGAATVPESLFRRMHDDLSIDSLGQAYGLTEAILVTQSRPNEDLDHIAETTGPAVEGMEVRIVDAVGQDVPVGREGEVLIRGQNVMMGYFEDEEATREAIDEEHWFHTGDMGRLDEHGCLKITDRIKDMFTVGGFNVYPAEVENVLATQPDVSESAVVGKDDPRMGSVAVAFVVPRPGSSPTPEEIIGHCRTRLANFKVPREVIVVGELPRNASGKILKTQLREVTSNG